MHKSRRVLETGCSRFHELHDTKNGYESQKQPDPTYPILCHVVPLAQLIFLENLKAESLALRWKIALFPATTSENYAFK
jgi:hypothetical protein